MKSKGKNVKYQEKCKDAESQTKNVTVCFHFEPNCLLNFNIIYLHSNHYRKPHLKPYITENSAMSIP